MLLVFHSMILSQAIQFRTLWLLRDHTSHKTEICFNASQVTDRRSEAAPHFLYLSRQNYPIDTAIQTSDFGLQSEHSTIHSPGISCFIDTILSYTKREQSRMNKLFLSRRNIPLDISTSDSFSCDSSTFGPISTRDTPSPQGPPSCWLKLFSHLEDLQVELERKHARELQEKDLKNAEKIATALTEQALHHQIEIEQMESEFRCKVDHDTCSTYSEVTFSTMHKQGEKESELQLVKTMYEDRIKKIEAELGHQLEDEKQTNRELQLQIKLKKLKDESDLAAKTRGAIEQIQAEYKTKLALIQTEQQAEVDAIHNEFEQVLIDKTSQVASIQKRKDEETAKLQAIATEHEAENDVLRKKLEQIKTDKDNQEAALRMEKLNAIEKLRSLEADQKKETDFFQKQFEQVKSESENQLEALRKEKDAAIANLQESLQQTISQCAKEVQQLKETHQTELETTKSSLEKDAKDAKDELESSKTDFEGKKKQFLATIASMEQSHFATEAKLGGERTEIEEKYKKQVEDLEAANKALNTEMEEKIAEMDKKHREEIAEMVATVELIETRKKERLDESDTSIKQKDETIATLKAQLEESSKKHREELADLSSKNQLISLLKKQMAELSNADEMKNKRQSETAKELNEVRSQLATALQSAQDLKDEMQNMESRHRDTIAEAERNHQGSEVEAVKKISAAAEKKLGEAKEAYMSLKQECQSKLSTAKEMYTNLKQEYESSVATIENMQEEARFLTEELHECKHARALQEEEMAAEVEELKAVLENHAPTSAQPASRRRDRLLKSMM